MLITNQNPKTVHLMLENIKEKQQIITFRKLETENV